MVSLSDTQAYPSGSLLLSTPMMGSMNGLFVRISANRNVPPGSGVIGGGYIKVDALKKARLSRWMILRI